MQNELPRGRGVVRYAIRVGIDSRIMRPGFWLPKVADAMLPASGTTSGAFDRNNERFSHHPKCLYSSVYAGLHEQLLALPVALN